MGVIQLNICDGRCPLNNLSDIPSLTHPYFLTVNRSQVSTYVLSFSHRILALYNIVHPAF